MTSPSPVPVLQSTPAPNVGPASYDAQLAAVTSVGEGVWILSAFAKAASVEVGGTFSALSIQLLGSNSPSEPINQYTMTVGGTVTTSDVLTLTFANPNLPAGTKAVAYTTIGGDTTTTIATALTAAINADTSLQRLGLLATSVGAVVTITYPNGYVGGQEGGSPSDPASQNTTIVTASKNGGASETLTVANASVGQNVGAAITAVGFTQLAILPKWIKAVVNTFTGTNVLANFHGAA